MRRKNTTLDMTKGYMSQALMQLLQKDKYEQITIGEVTRKAGVDRSTYYRHFTSKEDIIRYYYNSVMEECSTAFREKRCTSFSDYMRIRFEVLYSHKEELLKLHKNKLTYLLLDVMMQRYARDDHPNGLTPEQEFHRAYRIGGIYSTIGLWLDHRMVESPASMADMATRYRPEESLVPWTDNMADFL